MARWLDATPPVLRRLVTIPHVHFLSQAKLFSCYSLVSCNHTFKLGETWKCQPLGIAESNTSSLSSVGVHLPCRRGLRHKQG